MKQVIKKKEFLTNEQRQERMKRERIERQNEILKNRSVGLKEWSKTHVSADWILDIVMDALDYVPQKEKEVIVKFLRMPILKFFADYSDYLSCESELDNMDAVFDLLKEIHDISAKEICLESFDEYYHNLYKERESKEAKKTQAPVKEAPSNDDDGLPF